MGYATFVNFCTWLLYLCLLLIYFFQLDLSFSIAFILRNGAYETDDWTRRQNLSRTKCLWRQQSRGEILVLFGIHQLQIADCVSGPTFCHFIDHLRLLLENSLFKNLGRITCLGWNFVHCGRIQFTLTKITNKLISTKNCVFISWVGPSETGKLQLINNWL